MDSDIEHSRIMARLAELEMAEEAAGEDDDGDEDEDEEGEEIETNLRAAFRRSLLGDLDEGEEGDDDEDEDYDEDEEEEELDDRTAANTLLNSSAERLSEIGEESSGEEFQSSIITSKHGSQVQARGLGTPAAGPSGQRHVQFSGTENIANSLSPEPLPPKDVKASGAQQRVWSILTPKMALLKRLTHLS